MADSFIDPSSQASLDKLLAGLKAKDAELDQILTEARASVTQFGTMSRDTLAQQQAAARELSAAKPVQTGTGTIQETIAAVKQLAGVEADVNALLTKQVELRTQVAVAARAQGLGAAPMSAQAQATLLSPTGLAAAGAGAGAGGAAAGGGGAAAAARKAAAQAEQDRLIADAHAQRISVDDVTRSLERNILVTTQSSNAYQVHGAMTTEFIAAAAKGQVTLQEFGSQMASTIGKFAGWTAAAGAVYGVIGALSELVRGAVDGSTAVGMLHRTIDGLDNQQATAALVALAHETNTSMKEAGDAVFLFSRTFHTLDDATAAAKLGLQAFMLDQVPLADSVKALTALHLQYGLSLSELGDVYNMLALGQQQFAARMQVTIPFMITAAGAAKIAGTSYTDLAQIAVYAARVTQSTGPQIATAITRSMLTFSRKPTAQATFEALGLPGNEAITNYGEFLKTALAKSMTMSQSDRQKLGQALGGPLLGTRIFSRLIGGMSPELLKQLEGLTPASSKDKLTEEFAKFLGTPQQKIKEIVNDVQQLGTSLSSSGIQEPLKLIVGALDEALKLSTQLLQTWDKLPGPLKDIAGVGVAALGVRRLGQHFNIDLPGIRPSEESLRQTQVATGLDAQTKAYQEATAASARGAQAASVSTLAAVKARDETLAAVEAGGASEEALARDEGVLQDLTARQLLLERQTVGWREMTLASVKLQADYDAAIAEGLSSQAAEARVGITSRLNTLATGVPVTEPVVAAGAAASAAGAAGAARTGAGVAAATTLGTAGVTEAAAIETRQIGLLAAAKARLSKTLTLESDGLIYLSQEEEATAMALQESAFATQMFNRTVPLTAAAMTTARSAGSLLAGNLGKLALGIFGGVLIWDQVSQAVKQIDDAQNTFNASTRTASDTFSDYRAHLAAQKKDLQKLADKSAAGIFDGTPLAGVARSVSEQPMIHGLLHLAGADTQVDKAGSLQDEQKKWADRFQLYVDRVQADSVALGKSSEGRQRIWDEQLHLLHQAGLQAEGHPAAAAPLQTLRNAFQTQYEQLVRQFGALNPTGSDPFGGANRLDLPTNLKNTQALADRAKVYGPDRASLSKLAATWSWIGFKYADSTDSKSLQEIDQARTAAIGSVTQQVTNLLDAAKVATPAGAAKDFNKAERIVHDFQHALDVGYTAVKKRVDADLAQFMAFADTSYGLPSPAEQAAYDAYLKDKRNLQALGQANQGMKSQLGASLQSIYSARTGFSDPAERVRMQSQVQKAQEWGDPAAQAASDQRFAEHEQTVAKTQKDRLQAQLDLATADQEMWQAQQDTTNLRFQILEAQAAGDPSAQAGYMIQAARDAIANARTTNQRDQATLLMAQAQSSAHDAAVALTQSGFDLQKAQASGNPAEQAAIDIQAAQAQLAAARSQKERQDAEAQLANADYAYSQAVEARLQSHFKLLESRTTDPVVQARLELQAAIKAQADAVAHGGPGTQGSEDARAAVNVARQKVIDATLQQKEDNVQFHLTMGDISVQTAIGEYEALLHMHNITQAKRQQILEQIKSLKDGTQSDFGALDLGTIRLPTPYEIRRSIMQITQQGAAAISQQQGAAVYQQNTANIHVYDSRDASAVGVQLDRFIGGSGRALARAAGQR